MSDMIKTSEKICNSCLYGSSVNGCSYLLLTYQRRGCPVGLCDKYEKANQKERLHYHRQRFGTENRIVPAGCYDNY